MTAKEQKTLVRRIVDESDLVRVKTGMTNGRYCIHMRYERPEVRVQRDGEDELVPLRIESRTIYEVHEWNMHEWNKTTRNRDERSADRDLMAAIRNKEAQ